MKATRLPQQALDHLPDQAVAIIPAGLSPPLVNVELMPNEIVKLLHHPVNFRTGPFAPMHGRRKAWLLLLCRPDRLVQSADPALQLSTDGTGPSPSDQTEGAGRT